MKKKVVAKKRVPAAQESAAEEHEDEDLPASPSSASGGDAGQPARLLASQPLAWKKEDTDKITLPLLAKIEEKIRLFDREAAGKQELLSALQGDAQQHLLSLLNQVRDPAGGFYIPHQAFEKLSYQEVLRHVRGRLEGELSEKVCIRALAQAIELPRGSPDAVIGQLEALSGIPRISGEGAAKAVLAARVPHSLRAGVMASYELPYQEFCEAVKEVGFGRFDMSGAGRSPFLQDAGRERRPPLQEARGELSRKREAPSGGFGQRGPPGGRGRQFAPVTCHHCGRSGHVMRNCWELHPELRPPGVGRVNVVGSASDPGAATGGGATLVEGPA